MTSHFLLLLLFSALTAAVFAALAREEPRDQLRSGAIMFGGFVGAALLLGWLMLPFPL